MQLEFSKCSCLHSDISGGHFGISGRLLSRLVAPATVANDTIGLAPRDPDVYQHAVIQAVQRVNAAPEPSPARKFACERSDDITKPTSPIRRRGGRQVHFNALDLR